MAVKLLIYLIAGLGAGVGTGLAGLSAAAVISPMLITFLNVPAYEAVAIALASDVLASAISAYTYGKHKNLDIKNGLIMLCSVLIFTLVGSYIASLVPNSTMGGFSVFMTTLLGVKFIVRPVMTTKAALSAKSTGRKAVESIFCGVLIGFICGFIGAGGGMMLLLILTSVLGYELKTAVGTSVFIMTFTALTGALSQVASAVGMFGAMLLMPALFKKFNYKQLIISTSLVGAASSMVIWFLGYERFWLCIPFFVISCIPLGAINVCLGAMIGDCLDYMEWQTGTRLTGMGSAVQSFVNKLGNALSTSFIIVMYMIVNLNVADISANVTANPLAMSATVRSGMFSLISIIPAVSLLLCTIPLFFYDLVGEKKARVTRELAEQRKEKGVVIH